MKPSVTESPPARVITVAIVEDDSNVRESFSRLLQRNADFTCVATFPSAEAAIEGLPAARPAVALVDINLPGLSGVDCVRQLKPLHPEIQFVMLTVYENHDHVFSALVAGATGYLLKRTPPGELLDALRDVCRGGAPMSSQIARKVVESFTARHAAPAATSPTPAAEDKELSQLSGREREILEQLAKGYLAKEIAERLGISFDTVRTYSRRIYEKLHVHSRAQAVAKLLRPQS
ncbi:MAG TPA: DNA-binding response regulator [Verrucomicrobiales bacterium]|nr:DNA-binding response regulator [Verrucomicrobiales bacterium]